MTARPEQTLARSAILASINDGVKYETAMLMNSVLVQPIAREGLARITSVPQFLTMSDNAFLEAALLHLRNVRDFLITDGVGDDITARLLTKAWVRERDRVNVAHSGAVARLRGINDMLNKRLAHITMTGYLDKQSWDLSGAVDDVMELLAVLHSVSARREAASTVVDWIPPLAETWRVNRPQTDRFRDDDGELVLYLPHVDSRVAAVRQANRPHSASDRARS